FKTVDEMMYYAAQSATYEATEAYKSDCKYVLDRAQELLGGEGMSQKEDDYSIRLFQEVNRVFSQNPQMQMYCGQQIASRTRIQGFKLVDRILDIGLKGGIADAEKALANSNLSEETRKAVLNIINTAKESR